MSEQTPMDVNIDHLFDNDMNGQPCGKDEEKKHKSAKTAPPKKGEGSGTKMSTKGAAVSLVNHVSLVREIQKECEATRATAHSVCDHLSQQLREQQPQLIVSALMAIITPRLDALEKQITHIGDVVNQLVPPAESVVDSHPEQDVGDAISLGEEDEDIPTDDNDNDKNCVEKEASNQGDQMERKQQHHNEHKRLFYVFRKMLREHDMQGKQQRYQAGYKGKDMRQRNGDIQQRLSYTSGRQDGYVRHNGYGRRDGNGRWVGADHNGYGNPGRQNGYVRQERNVAGRGDRLGNGRSDQRASRY